MFSPSLSLTALIAVALLAPWPTGTHAQPAVSAPRQTAESPRELLNSERIERQFGSYGIEVLHSDAGLRVSNLYSESDGARIGRTFAVVFYPTEIDPRFAAEHAQILDGGSIGAVFARGGWTVTKRHLWFGTLESTPKLEGLMGVDAGTALAAHVYVLSVSRAGATFEYAAICEVHHPEYLRLADLRSVYGAPAVERADRNALPGRILDATRSAMR